MRIVLVAMLLVGCVEGPSVETVEAGPSQYCIDHSPPWCHDDACMASWCAPIGSACSVTATQFCGFGADWCSSGTCRSFCSPVNYPRCPAGQSERHAKSDGADVCTCE